MGSVTLRSPYERPSSGFYWIKSSELRQRQLRRGSEPARWRDRRSQQQGLGRAGPPVHVGRVACFSRRRTKRGIRPFRQVARLDAQSEQNLMTSRSGGVLSFFRVLDATPLAVAGGVGPGRAAKVSSSPAGSPRAQPLPLTNTGSMTGSRRQYVPCCGRGKRSRRPAIIALVSAVGRSHCPVNLPCQFRETRDLLATPQIT